MTVEFEKATVGPDEGDPHSRPYREPTSAKVVEHLRRLVVEGDESDRLTDLNVGQWATVPVEGRFRRSGDRLTLRARLRVAEVRIERVDHFG